MGILLERRDPTSKNIKHFRKRVEKSKQILKRAYQGLERESPVGPPVGQKMNSIKRSGEGV